MLKIYGRANAIKVRSVLWLVGELGVDFEQFDWGRGYRSTSEPEFARLSPFGKVPIISDDGFVVRETNTILRYLARKAQRVDLLPSDMRPAAEVEAWMDWGATDLTFGYRPVFFGLSVKSPAYRDDRLIETGISEWSREMRILDRHLATNGPYLIGDGLTIADIVVGALVHRWFAIDFNKPHLASVTAYYDRLSSREPFLRHVRNGMP